MVFFVLVLALGRRHPGCDRVMRRYSHLDPIPYVTLELFDLASVIRRMAHFFALACWGKGVARVSVSRSVFWFMNPFLFLPQQLSWVNFV